MSMRAARYVIAYTGLMICGMIGLGGNGTASAEWAWFAVPWILGLLYWSGKVWRDQ